MTKLMIPSILDALPEGRAKDKVKQKSFYSTASINTDLLTDAQRTDWLFRQVYKVVSPARIAHIMGVTHTVCVLSIRHGLSIQNAVQAGLLHDLAKEVPANELKRRLDQLQIEMTPQDLATPALWHGIYAAVFAQKYLGASDELVEAVWMHSTADENISRLTKALFIADLCEPNRPSPPDPSILELAQRDLDQGFCKALLHKALHVRFKKQAAWHPRSLRAVKQYLNMTPAQLMLQPHPWNLKS